MVSERRDNWDWPAAAAGDEEAFGRVFDRHAVFLYRFAHRRTGDRDVSEEIAAEVFLVLWTKRFEVELLDGSLRPWLLGVASNLIRRHWRTTDRGSRALDRLPSLESEPDPADRITERVDGASHLDRLSPALSALRDEQLEVLLLWAWEQLSYQEIAEALAVPVGTVRSRLFRARTSLRAMAGTENGDREFPDVMPPTADPDQDIATERRK